LEPKPIPPLLLPFPVANKVNEDLELRVLVARC
jgi:hypothetical protein